LADYLRVRMKVEHGFTLMELMLVILIIGILAAVAIPLMRGRINSAKWSEAEPGAGTIRTAIRAYWAERGPTYADYAAELAGDVTVFGGPLGITPSDLDGRYFGNGCYKIQNIAVGAGGLQYDIVVTAAADPGPGGTPSSPAAMTMDETGGWQ
jgi:prepilin-type N-terminal cleavage/methylation domain-containing protein